MSVQHIIYDSEILTVSGEYFNFQEPYKSRVDISTIAHALANICRFTGHTSHFYSVAQHSRLVSEILPPELQLAGLLHDAAEAFIGDVSTPLKQRLPEYRRIEVIVEKEISRKFGIPYPFPDEVKRADLIMLATEKRDLLPCTQPEWEYPQGICPCNLKISPESPTVARVMFMARYLELMGKS